MDGQRANRGLVLEAHPRQPVVESDMKDHQPVIEDFDVPAIRLYGFGKPYPLVAGEEIGPFDHRVLTGEGRLEYAFAVLRRKGQALGPAIGNGVELDVDHRIAGDFSIAFCIPEKRW